jgi:hypothetical protein
MPEKTMFDVCYLCTETAQIQNLGASFLVHCSRCGPYEIEAVAATIELTEHHDLYTYLEKERRAGKDLPFVSRELLKR